jgi:hypothetical protein
MMVGPPSAVYNMKGVRKRGIDAIDKVHPDMPHKPSGSSSLSREDHEESKQLKLSQICGFY